VANRPDVFFPDNLVRDDKGRVIGAESLASWANSSDWLVIDD